MIFDYILIALFTLYILLNLQAGFLDVRHMRISNELNLTLFITCLAISGLYALKLGQWAPIWDAGLGFCLCLILMLALFYFNLFGGGDAKMIIALSAFFGLKGLYPFLMLTGLSGGLLALSLLGLRLVFRRIGTQEAHPLHHIFKPKGDIPYGVAIGLGAILALPFTAPGLDFILSLKSFFRL